MHRAGPPAGSLAVTDMSALLISDLHLSPLRPDITAAFHRLLDGPASRAGCLYILGDLFDYWAGDDDLSDPFHAGIVRALAECADRIRVYFMHGNRDFLVGPEFAAAARVELVSDPLRISIGDRPTLLMHGDTLCTDDLAYQRFRAEVRSPDWIAAFLALPLAERKQRIAALRAQSESQKRVKASEIMDVNAAAVEAALRTHGCDRLIHGHTHRPALHRLDIEGRPCERWVLGDWYSAGSFLFCKESGLCTPHPV